MTSRMHADRSFEQFCSGLFGLVDSRTESSWTCNIVPASDSQSRCMNVQETSSGHLVMCFTIWPSEREDTTSLEG